MTNSVLLSTDNQHEIIVNKLSLLFLLLSEITFTNDPGKAIKIDSMSYLT